MPKDLNPKTTAASLDHLLCGARESHLNTISLRAGPLELEFERDRGWVRRVRLGRRELIRAIYGAVRDQHWTTIPTVIRDLSLEQRPGESFELGFQAVCRQGNIDFAWQGRITGTAAGELRFEFDGQARSEFLRNRIGLCVLHPIAECAGQACRVEHSDGSRQAGVFPKLISPFQPFLDLRAIAYRAAKSSTIEVRFAGDVFEMEDQRNWTDASFKTYSTPLSRPLPALVKRDQRIHQIVTVKLVSDASDAAPKNASRPIEVKQTRPISVSVDFGALRVKRPLGLGVAERQETLHPIARRRLRALRLDHLRVDCRLWERSWSARLERANQQAVALGVGLHVAVFVPDDAEPALRKLATIAATLRAPVKLWLVFQCHQMTTPSGVVALARQLLTPVAPGAQFAAGTDANFADLNRARPARDATWLPCCSIHPQAHASDCLTMIENLAAQADVVKAVRSFSRRPLVISPITLRARPNPDAVGRNTLLADERQSSLFAAGWTLASLAALMASPSVHSLTYFENVGPGGIVAAGPQARVYPVYHSFAAVTELRKLATTRVQHGRAAQGVAALAGVNEAGRAVIWLANLSPDSITVEVHTKPRFQSLVIKSIDERNAANLLRSPEKWWRSPTTNRFVSVGSAITLRRYGLARLEEGS